MSETKHTLTASIWTISGKLCARLFDLVLLLYLSRVLTPEDFGLIALAMAPIYIGEAILELPLVQVLLRFEKPEKNMYDTAFTLSVLRGLALATIFIGLSWPISQLYSEARLTLLVCVLSIAPILRGTFSPRMVIFMKQMDFTREFLLDVVGKAVAFCTAVIITSLYKSYWAIAAATITAPLAMNVLSYIIAPYRPRFTLSGWSHFSDMVGWTSATQIFSAINWQMDRLFLGRFVTTETLGQYSLANEIVSIPFRSFVSPLANPLMANFTRKTTPGDLAESYNLSISTIFICIAPIWLGLSLLAEPFILLVLGEKWAEAVPIVQWLSVLSILALPMAPLAPLALSLDRTRYSTLRVGVEFVIKFIVMVFGVYHYGIWGAIWAYGIANAVSLVTTFLIVRKLINLPIKAQITPLFRGAFSLAIMGLVLWFIRPVDLSGNTVFDVLSLLLSGLLGGLAYILSVFGIWTLRKKPLGVEKTIVDYVSERIHNAE